MQTRKKIRTMVDEVCLVRKIAPSTVLLQFKTREKKIVLLSKKIAPVAIPKIITRSMSTRYLDLVHKMENILRILDLIGSACSCWEEREENSVRPYSLAFASTSDNSGCY